MMRVMVVEDEEMIRKGIVMAVDWAALDCIVVGEAANGEQALPSRRTASRRLSSRISKCRKWTGWRWCGGCAKQAAARMSSF